MPRSSILHPLVISGTLTSGNFSCVLHRESSANFLVARQPYSHNVGSGSRVWSPGCRNQGAEPWIQGPGSRALGGLQIQDPEPRLLDPRCSDQNVEIRLSCYRGTAVKAKPQMRVPSGFLVILETASGPIFKEGCTLNRFQNFLVFRSMY